MNTLSRPVAIATVLSIVLVGGGIVLAVNTGSLPINRDLKLQDVIGLLETMFVVALFLERSLEVFISVWRGPEEAVKDTSVQQAQRAMAVARAAGALPPATVTALETAERERNVYKAETKRIAMLAAVAAGVLIAAAGLRSFELFVRLPASHSTEWEKFAGGLFNALNVIVTGGLIGGGSDVIHQIVKVVTEFFKATADRIEQQRPPGSV